MVWMEHWLWEGRDAGHEALGQQRKVKADLTSMDQIGVYLLEPPFLPG